MVGVTRRAFFQSAAERFALIAIASRAAACKPDPMQKATRYLAPKEAAVLAAIADTIVPPVAALTVRPSETDLVDRVERFLLAGDPLTSRQFRFLLSGIEHHPQLFTTHFRRFTELDEKARASVLASFAGSRYFVKRMAFTALKSVVCNHYFAIPSVQEKLGYAPSCRW